MNQYIELLKGALAGIDAGDREKRIRIYEAASRALARLPKDQQENQRAQLFDTITVVEREYLSRAQSAAEPMAPSDKEHEVRPEQPPTATLPDHNFDVDTPKNRTSLLPKVPVRKSLMIAAFVGATLLVGWVLVSVIGMKSGNDIASERSPEVAGDAEIAKTDPGATDVSEAVSGEQPPTGTKPIVNINLSAGFSALSTHQKRDALQQEEEADYLKDGQFVVSIAQTFYAGPQFDVDPDKQYLMTLSVEIAPGNKGLPKILAGFATFDSKGDMEKTDDSSSRFFVSNGRIDNSFFDKTTSRINLTNIITGRETGSNERFWDDTKSARAVVRIVPAKDSPVIIRNISVYPL